MKKLTLALLGLFLCALALYMTFGTPASPVQKDAPAPDITDAPLQDDQMQNMYGPYYRMGVIGDGSCFIHALAKASNFMNYRTSPVDRRHAIVKHVRQHVATTLDPDFTAGWHDATDTDNTTHFTHENVQRLLADMSTYVSANFFPLFEDVFQVSVMVVDPELRLIPVHRASDDLPAHRPVVYLIHHLDHFELLCKLRPGHPHPKCIFSPKGQTSRWLLGLTSP